MSFGISTSSAHHQLVISSSSARHQLVISSSSARHQLFISSSSDRHQKDCDLPRPDLAQTKSLITCLLHGVSIQPLNFVVLLVFLFARTAQSSPLRRSWFLALLGSIGPHLVKLQGEPSVHFQSPSFIRSVAPIHTKSGVFSYKMGHVGDV